MQSPLFVGVAGGVGTTTVAAALGARDGGRYRGQQSVQVVVCADTVVSVGTAHRVISHTATRPVLVVVAATPARMGRVAAGRVDMVRDQVTAVVRVPHVPRWRETADPYAQAAAVLRYPTAVPNWLKRFARAMSEIAYRLRSGQIRSTGSQGVTGSNPVSSTREGGTPGQTVFRPVLCPDRASPGVAQRSVTP